MNNNRRAILRLLEKQHPIAMTGTVIAGTVILAMTPDNGPEGVLSMGVRPGNMNSSPLWSNLFRGKAEWIKQATELCAENPLFAGLHPNVIRWLVSRMHPRSYKKGETIFDMETPGAGAVLLLAGEVSIMANQVELARLVRGDLFGEVALVSDQPRTAKAVAMENCGLVFFLRSDLHEWMGSRPRQASRLLVNLAEMLAQRLMQANQQLTHKAVP